jgi:hypothetical protein
MLSRASTTLLISVVAFTCFTIPAFGQAVTDGLISYWSFDEDDIEGDVVMDVWDDQHAAMNGSQER